MRPTTQPDRFDKNEVATGGKSRRKAVFAFLELMSVMEEAIRPGPALRTRVYVDGYNLYYGCLRGTPHKWLDVPGLFSSLLRTVLVEVDGQAATSALDPLQVKFFTAPILKAFADSDESVPSQVHYHQALSGHCGHAIQIIQGYYDSKPARARLYVEGQNPRESEKREIWKLEEKQSDVALALHAYSDVMRGEIDHVVIVSNDTDLVPALEMIRAHTGAKIGLVTPAKDDVLKVNTSLSELADWTRAHITVSELLASQLPTPVRVPDTTNVIHKPLSWYPRPDLLMPIFVEAKRVKRSVGAAWKWLNQPCERLEGRCPVDMSANDAETAQLWAYMNDYAKQFNPKK